MEMVQRKKTTFAAKKVKTKGCNVSNKLPGLWKSFKSWMYLTFIIATIVKHSSSLGKHTTEETSFILPKRFLSVAFQGNEEAVKSSIEQDNIKISKGININCNPDKQYPIYMHGQIVLLANKDVTQDGERYLFVDEVMSIEFGLDNCCTNHVCCHKRLFKEMRETPGGIGILGIGRVRKPKRDQNSCISVNWQHGKCSSHKVEE
eukprot:7668272-Ditylum_brightwellii.AAC.1